LVFFLLTRYSPYATSLSNFWNGIPPPHTHVNFNNFKKALDSVHRESLWKILRHYGVPFKIMSLIGLFYDHFECGVILDNTVSEAFPVKSRVRQGFILSPILFLTIIDWIMRITILDQPRGIQWTPFAHLD